MPSQAGIEQVEDARLTLLLKTVCNAFLDFFDDRLDEYASGRAVRIADFVKEEINLHLAEAGERMKARVEELRQDMQHPFTRERRWMEDGWQTTRG